MAKKCSHFKDINTFVLDVDGVLTDGWVMLFPDTDPIRRMNIKDGYAIQLAVKKGYNVCIISGGKSEAIATRLRALGVQDIFMSVSNKLVVFQQYLESKNISPEQVMYVGDDMPDLEPMEKAGIAVAPCDASQDVLENSDYITQAAGGRGCVREVIEKVLKTRNQWYSPEALYW